MLRLYSPGQTISPARPNDLQLWRTLLSDIHNSDKMRREPHLLLSQPSTPSLNMIPTKLYSITYISQGNILTAIHPSIPHNFSSLRIEPTVHRNMTGNQKIQIFLVGMKLLLEFLAWRCGWILAWMEGRKWFSLSRGIKQNECSWIPDHPFPPS